MPGLGKTTAPGSSVVDSGTPEAGLKFQRCVKGVLLSGSVHDDANVTDSPARIVRSVGGSSIVPSGGIPTITVRVSGVGSALASESVHVNVIWKVPVVWNVRLPGLVCVDCGSP